MSHRIVEHDIALPADVFATLNYKQEEAAITVLSEAFADDPTYRFGIPDVDSMDLDEVADRISPLIRRYLEAGSALGGFTIHHSNEQGEVDGAALWFPPGAKKASALELLRTVPATIRAYRRNVPKVYAAFLSMKNDAPHDTWHLYLIGSRLQARGQGVGSQLMSAVLAKADELSENSYLENSNPHANELFYKRLGYEVIGRHCWAKDPKIPIDFMLREPRPRCLPDGPEHI